MLNLGNQHKDHKHCYHIFNGFIAMVIPDGHVIEKCCSCNCMRTIHREHIVINHRL